MTNGDLAENLALLVNTSAQTEFLLHSLEQATEGIGRNDNAYKRQYMCFKRIGPISTLSGEPLK